MANKIFNVKVNGLSDVIRRYERIVPEVVQKVDRELETAARNVAADAMAHAPKDQGNLAASIGVNAGQKYNKIVFVDSPIAAYQEAGTGKYVFKGPYAFNTEQKQFFRQFYVSGKGTTRSHPYLFPAFDRELPRLQKRLENVLTTL